MCYSQRKEGICLCGGDNDNLNRILLFPKKKRKEKNHFLEMLRKGINEDQGSGV